MKEEVFGCIFTNIFHKFLPLFELPSKYCGLQLYLCNQKMPFQPFQSNLWDCTRMGQSDMIFTYVQTTPAGQQSSPGTPEHTDLLPALMMCTSNQTPRKILQGQILLLEGTVPSAEIPPATGTLLPHWLNLVDHLSQSSQSHKNIPGMWRSRGRGKTGEQQEEEEV